MSAQLLGVDTINAKDVRQTHQLIEDHIAHIRANVHGLHDAMCILLLESNLAYESQHILHYISAKGVKNWCALSEGAAGSLGWLTTNQTKEAGCLLFREALRTHNLFLSSEFFSTQMTERDAIKQIKEELMRFSVITDPPKTAFGRVRRTYTGKVGGQNDDLAIVLMLSLQGLRKFYTEDKYATWRPVT